MTIRQDDSNARRRTPRGKEAIRKSLERFGPARSIVVDKDDVVRAGNGTFEEAQELGIPIRVIETDGDELIAVKRKDWTGDEATAYAVADNKLTDLSEFDFEQLAGTLREMDTDLQNATGFEDFELEPLLQAEWHPPEKEGDLADHQRTEHHTVAFSADQWEVIRQAVEKFRENENDSTIGGARAIELICAEWLS